jgi:hypothetical protein
MASSSWSASTVRWLAIRSNISRFLDRSRGPGSWRTQRLLSEVSPPLPGSPSLASPAFLFFRFWGGNWQSQLIRTPKIRTGGRTAGPTALPVGVSGALARGSLIPIAKCPHSISAHYVRMAIRTCQCGAVYDRTETVVSQREIESFECKFCGTTLESWHSALVPRYRFLSGPVRPPREE